MFYLTQDSDIRQCITYLKNHKTIWLDTEVADWHTPNKRLSLIQATIDPNDLSGQSAYLMDVLDCPHLIHEFIQQIMVDPKIQKVFHNASYDLQFLDKNQSKNIICTLKLAKIIPLETLGTPNRKLKTLAVGLCGFSNIDVTEQSSDWGQRPLTQQQLNYAKMDVVYLAQVHRRLLELKHPNSMSPTNSATSTDSAFSVTDVRVAFECPRLFYLGHRFGGMTMFLPKNEISGIGRGFHQLSEKLAKLVQTDPHFKTLFDPPQETLQVNDLAAQIQTVCYEKVFYPLLTEKVQTEPQKAPAFYQLWQGLTRLIHRWTELLVNNRKYCDAETVIQKTLIDIKPKIEHVFQLPNGNQQLVRGIFDSLIYDFEQHRLCIIEYKTYQSPDQSAQLAQVALYSYMLREKLGVPIDSAVYSVLPDWQELSFTWDQLENTVHQMIPQKLQQMQDWIAWQPSNPDPPPETLQTELCEICPQRKKCQTFFEVDSEFNQISKSQKSPTNKVFKASDSKTKNSKVITPQKTSSQATTSEPIKKDNKISQSDLPEIQPVQDQSDSVNADQMGQELVTTLESFGIKTDYIGAAIGPAFIRVKLKPHPGVKVASLLRLSDDLQVQLGIGQPPLIAPNVGFVSVDLPRPDRQTALFNSYVQPQETDPGAPLKVAIGVNLDNQLIDADLSDSNTCHFLVGGTTGSGKSEFLRSMLLSLLYHHSPRQLRIALVDPKRVTFPEFEQMPWLYGPVVKTDGDAIQLMGNLVDEMTSRYQMLELAGCPDIKTYNQTQATPLDRIVCIFDEYADFMAEKEIRQELELSIKRLGAMARAAGIHLIIATQRPEANVVTPLIRSNLPGRVALRTASGDDSKIILGGRQTLAAQLLGKGDLLYQVGAKLERLQSLFAPEVQLP
ncbi:MAG: DNA translocase FtsK [Microcoleaceae cyanobacterium]